MRYARGDRSCAPTARGVQNSKAIAIPSPHKLPIRKIDITSPGDFQKRMKQAIGIGSECH
jgi:hypothetical protein